MSSIFSRALNACQTALMGVAGFPAVYRRGTQRANITVRQGRTRRTLETGDVVRVEDGAADWIVKADDLRFRGRLFTPEVDDEVLVTIGARTTVYRLFQPSPVDAHYSPVDVGGFELRLHTKITEAP